VLLVLLVLLLLVLVLVLLVLLLVLLLMVLLVLLVLLLCRLPVLTLLGRREKEGQLQRAQARLGCCRHGCWHLRLSDRECS
jgi:hypothetical protein